MRGSLLELAIVNARGGSIPASAGEPGRKHSRRDECGVYPRECGGAFYVVRVLPGDMGLSPRVRGSHVAVADDVRLDGSIPASAGEPTRGPWRWRGPRVYPRECGGADDRTGVLADMKGLSPRVRGSHPDRLLDHGSHGSIPASAGEPSTSPSRGGTLRVYPRECGGA